MEREEDLIDKQIGNYLLIKKLGTGAYGSVYLAQHRYLSRSLIAIKILNRKQLVTSKDKEAFFNEAKFLDILKHRHILPILDVGIQEGLPYMVIEYAPNGSLRDRIISQRPARLPMQEALLILSQTGQALQYAHQHNVVHRDLKPANILFNEKGEALLADFGIALQLKGTGDAEDIEGTLQYMAPEQFDKKVSIKSDQYALACIAYELFTGDIPIVASPQANLSQWYYLVQHKEPKPPRQINPDLSIEIEEAILQALKKDRTMRHFDIASFIASMMSGTRLLDVSDVPTILMDEKQLQEFQKVLADPGKTIEQWLTEAENLCKNNRLEEALVAYEQAIQLGHHDPAVYYVKGNILHQLKKPEEALAAYEQAIQLGHNDAMAYYYMGYILSELKRLEGALVSYESAIQIDSNKAIFYGGKGNVLRELMHYADALKAYDEAIRLSPKTPIYHINKGEVLLAYRDYEKALEAYDQAIQVVSNKKISARAYVGKGNTLLRLRRNKESVEAFEIATKLDPNIANASLYLSKGDAFWRSGQNEKALKAYELGIDLDPQNEILRQKRDAMLDILVKSTNRTRR